MTAIVELSIALSTKIRRHLSILKADLWGVTGWTPLPWEVILNLFVYLSS